MTIRQGLVIASGLVLVLILFLLRNTPEQKTAIEVMLLEGKEALPPEDLERIERLESEAVSGGDEEGFRALAAEWRQRGNEGIAALYAYRAAQTEDTAEAWKNAGDQLSAAFYKIRERDVSDNLKFYFISTAVKSYEKAVELKPQDMDLKIDLALAHAEGQGSVMEGVQLLRQVIEEDPGNLRANLALGRFSMFSGQYEKALERYHTVLNNHPENIEAMIMMSSAYQALGSNAQAKEYLLRASEITDDQELLNEINNRLIELNK